MSISSEEDVALELAARAARLARPVADERDEDRLELLVLEVCGQQVAVPVTDVREVRPPSALAQVPGCNQVLVGLVGGHGQALAVASLAELLGLGCTTPVEQQWVTVLEHPTAPLGLLADRVMDIVTVGRTDLSPTTDSGEIVSDLVRDGPIVLTAAALLRDPRLSLDPLSPNEEHP